MHPVPQYILDGLARLYNNLRTLSGAHFSNRRRVRVTSYGPMLEVLEWRLCLSGSAAVDTSVAAPVVIAQHAASATDYGYARHGNTENAGPMTGLGGIALEGGGTDVAAAFQWMIGQMGGKGDFLVLTATKNTAYDSYIYNLGGVNSVATLEIPSRAGALDPAVTQIIESADAIFIAGGAQNDYINYWQGTPVQAAIADDVARGVPIGGTSAGADVIGQFVYSALNNSATSAEALANPLNTDMTFAENFASTSTSLPLLDNTIVDTHFITEDRTGRMIAFLADLANPTSPDAFSPNHQPMGIGINEQTALLIPTETNSSLGETAGIAMVVGNAKAKSPPQVEFFDTPAWQNGFVDVSGTPLTYGPVQVDDVTPEGTFDLNDWASNWLGSRSDSTLSTISVTNGVLTTTPYGNIATNNIALSGIASMNVQSDSEMLLGVVVADGTNGKRDHH